MSKKIFKHTRRVSSLSPIKKFFIVVFGIALVVVSWKLYTQAVAQGTYNALPTVPCIDDTKKIVKSFTLRVSIRIYGKKFPLDKTIGHDHGNCLRAIHTMDTSGEVTVSYNFYQPFTLGNFFEVWHKKFTTSQLFEYSAKGHKLQVFVNGVQVTSAYESILLAPNQNISIIYF